MIRFYRLNQPVRAPHQPNKSVDNVFKKSDKRRKTSRQSHKIPNTSQKNTKITQIRQNLNYFSKRHFFFWKTKISPYPSSSRIWSNVWSLRMKNMSDEKTRKSSKLFFLKETGLIKIHTQIRSLKSWRPSLRIFCLRQTSKTHRMRPVFHISKIPEVCSKNNKFVKHIFKRFWMILNEF